MDNLTKELLTPKSCFQEFYGITLKLKDFVENQITKFEEKNDYRICVCEKKFLRPINKQLYILDKTYFPSAYDRFQHTIQKIKFRNLSDISEEEKRNIDSVLYTIQQTIGVGMDLLVDSNRARKNLGNKFEELISVVFSAIEIDNKRIVFSKKVLCDEKPVTYKCENDLILSNSGSVQSTPEKFTRGEIIISVKTTSKDRMGKMFIDKILLQKFLEHTPKVIGIFHNDVQRKKHNNISFTLVPNLFMIYTENLVRLNGIYYLDPPPHAKKEPYNKHIKSFSDLIASDLFNLFES